MPGLDTPHTREAPSSLYMWGRCLALGLLLLTSSGCFRYVSVPLETVPVGEAVRLVVTRDGAAEYRDITGSEDPLPVVTGKLTERNAQSLILNIPVAVRREGFHQVGIDAAVRVPLSEVLATSRRELNLFATGAVTVGAAGFAVLLVRKILTSGPNSQGTPGVSVDQSVTTMPFFRIPLGS